MGFLGPKEEFSKNFRFWRNRPPSMGSRPCEWKKILKIKISGIAFSFELKFCRKFKRRKIHLLSKFQPISSKIGKILDFLKISKKSGKNQNFEKSPGTSFYFHLKYHVSEFQVDTIEIGENIVTHAHAPAQKRFWYTEIMAIF